MAERRTASTVSSRRGCGRVCDMTKKETAAASPGGRFRAKGLAETAPQKVPKKKAASAPSSASGDRDARATPKFSPASLRRLLGAGVRLIEGNMAYHAEHHPFSAITLAAYFSMTARQAWSALDDLAT